MQDDKKTDVYENENPSQVWLTDDSLVDTVNVRWRTVIDELMNRQKIYIAYARAYDIDITKPGQQHVAEANGSRLLRNAEFKKLWSKVIEERGFNEQTADWILTDLMTSPSVEPKVQLLALKHFNELSGRVIKKTDVTSNGETIAPIVLSQIKPRDVIPKAETATGN